jgi:thioredoxin-like negative regulator of GroEL
VRQLTSAEFESFIAAKPAAAIHFDADWDVAYRPLMRISMLDAAKALADKANFGDVNVDRNVELAKAVRLLNVPAVGYYRDGCLVALLIGARQNVRRRLERVICGEAIGCKDGNDEGPA